MRFEKDDGGREAAGFKGSTGDCVVRAAAIALGLPYQKVYDDLYRRTLSSPYAMSAIRKRVKPERVREAASPRLGVYKQVYGPYLEARGLRWTPTMFIGQGCKVHLVEEELPDGVLVVRLSRHTTAIVNGVIHDTYDPSREGNRCVYGYWRREA